MKKPSFLSKLKKEGKLDLIEPTENRSNSYIIKSSNCIKAAKLLQQASLFENAISEAYYAMYNITLSLFFKAGIKSENHTATIIMLRKAFGLTEFSGILRKAKTERVDKQYYVIENAKQATEQETKQMILEAEEYCLLVKDQINKLSYDEIENARKRFVSLTKERQNLNKNT